MPWQCSAFINYLSPMCGWFHLVWLLGNDAVNVSCQWKPEVPDMRVAINCTCKLPYVFQGIWKARGQLVFVGLPKLKSQERKPEDWLTPTLLVSTCISGQKNANTSSAMLHSVVISGCFSEQNNVTVSIC